MKPWGGDRRQVVRLATTLAIVAATSAGCRPEPGFSPDAGAADAGRADAGRADAGRAEADAWFQERLTALRREGGWLSLVGLDWLPEGSATYGHAAENDIVVPVDTGVASLGTFERHGTRVSFLPAADATVLVDGEPVGETAADTAAEAPLFRHGRLGFFALQRGDRVGVRLFDTESPLLLSFDTIERFPFAPRFRTTGRLRRDPEATTLAVPNILGDVNEEPSPGRLVFEIEGRRYSLAALEGGKEGDLFLVFGDPTNGETTYGGGRFLYTSPPRPDGTYEIDFNRAYNPPCVLTAFATCPLPPEQNRLPLRVEAGERMWGAPH